MDPADAASLLEALAWEALMMGHDLIGQPAEECGRGVALPTPNPNLHSEACSRPFAGDQVDVCKWKKKPQFQRPCPLVLLLPSVLLHLGPRYLGVWLTRE